MTGVIPAEREQFNKLAAQLRDLQDSNKTNTDKLLEKARGDGIDPAGLRRFVSWKRQDPDKRAQREAIDHQCRYLAGEVDTPAKLPIGCELYRALHLYRRKMTVRQVADEMKISTGKAGNLYKLARMFGVHVHENVDSPKVDVITPPAAAALPAHDPATGEVLEVAGPAEGIGHNSKRACILPRPDAWKEITSARDATEAAWAAEAARIAAEKEAAIERKRRELEALKERNRRIDADDLAIPSYLRRVPA
jgi:uncharacterized protein (UPF0335 family)